MHQPSAHLLLALLTASLAVGQKVPDADAQQKLINWVESQGGKVGFKLGKDCAACPRGAIATRDFKAEETIAEVPFKLAIKLGLAGEASPDGAIDLIKQRMTSSSHNATYALFWESQPALDEVLTPDLFSDEMVDMLQSEQLETIVRAHRGYTEAVYEGTAGKYEGHSLQELLGGDAAKTPSLEQFKWYSSLIVSRAFSFWVDGEDDRTRTYFFPAIDMINHSEGDAVNCYRWEYDEEGVVRQVAKKDIKKGEQLYQIYHAEMLHRPDMSLLVYGFVMPMEPPMLAAVDLHDFDAEQPYETTPTDDSAYDERGNLATGAELGRLLDIKRSWPTTLQEDEQLQASGAYKDDWRKETILQFRIQRKRAVVNIIKSLLETLAEL